jgi:hypothetical protein
VAAAPVKARFCSNTFPGDCAIVAVVTKTKPSNSKDILFIILLISIKNKSSILFAYRKGFKQISQNKTGSLYD